jgi:protein TonB
VIIAKDGTIERLQSVSGPALLLTAAIDAVKRWRYKPTLLNGSPVEVETKILVEFRLKRDSPHP